jgi:hypothetical protein
MSLARFKTDQAISKCKFHIRFFTHRDAAISRLIIQADIDNLRITLSGVEEEKSQYVQLKNYSQEFETTTALKDILQVKDAFDTFSIRLNNVNVELVAMQKRYKKKILFHGDDFQEHFKMEIKKLETEKNRLTLFFETEKVLHFEEEKPRKVKVTKILIPISPQLEAEQRTSSISLRKSSEF